MLSIGAVDWASDKEVSRAGSKEIQFTSIGAKNLILKVKINKINIKDKGSWAEKQTRLIIMLGHKKDDKDI